MEGREDELQMGTWKWVTLIFSGFHQIFHYIVSKLYVAQWKSLKNANSLKSLSTTGLDNELWTNLLPALGLGLLLCQLEGIKPALFLTKTTNIQCEIILSTVNDHTNMNYGHYIIDEKIFCCFFKEHIPASMLWSFETRTAQVNVFLWKAPRNSPLQKQYSHPPHWWLQKTGDLS